MHSNGKIFGFNSFRRLGDFTRSIYFDDISLEMTKDKHGGMEFLL